MTTMAVHLRIIGLQVTNEDVTSRKTAATALAAKWGRLRSAGAIVQKAAEIAQALSSKEGRAAEGLVAEVEAAIQESAAAFLAKESPLEVSICAGVAMIELLSSDNNKADGWSSADIYAACIWSALGFQTPLEDAKREALRVQVQAAAQYRCVTSSENARERSQVPEVPEVPPAAPTDAKTLQALRKAVVATITALKRNAALDREEIDFLWWLQSRTSRILREPLSTLDESVRALVLAIEAAQYLRRLPSDAHRDIVHRTVGQNPETTLPELLLLLGSHREKLAQRPEVSSGSANPTVFPLLNAIATGNVDGVGSGQKRTASEWGERALLETGLFHMLKTNGTGAA